MLELFAIAIIAAGIILLIRGLTEGPERMYNMYPSGLRDLEEAEGWDEWDRGREWSREDEWKKRGKESRREVKAGGVVLIGPIPIVFGDSKYASLALILAIILMLLSIIYVFSLQAVV